MPRADGPGAFGALLHEYRAAAGFSQEELAELAGLSRRGISDLERGERRSPHPVTVRRLAEALNLDHARRAALLASAHMSAGPNAATAFSLRSARHNLPIQLTSLIGRQRDVADLGQQLGPTRLVTLTGPGGIGKTRLALEVAEAVLDRYPDGVWLVELAGLSDGTLVAQAVLTALGMREQQDQSSLSTLMQSIGERQVLLVLDNCEHLVEACASLVHQLLRSSPGLVVLATSREPLGVAGETTWRVAPLSLPSRVAPIDVDSLLESAAVRLFVDRARSAVVTFALSEETAPFVARLCHVLAGIPLAIELAAPRVRVLSVQQIAARMDDALQLLAGSSRSGPARHHTLRAALAWSYGLLSDPEQQLFERLAVFVGGWTLEAATTVGAGDSINTGAVFDLLSSLVDKSLVVVEPGHDGTMRYRLLEPLRQYAGERLDARHTAEVVRARHADYFIDLGEQAELHLRGGPQRVRWLNRLAAEQGNLRAALGWCTERGETERGLRLGGTVWRWWLDRGTLQEGRTWLELLLRLAAGEPRTAHRARALNGAGVLELQLEDYPAAQLMLEESRAIWMELGQDLRATVCLRNLAVVAQARGDHAAARRCFQEALVSLRQHGDRIREAECLSAFAWALLDQGDYALARDVSEQSLALYCALSDPYSSAWPTMSLAWSKLLGSGDTAAARTLFEEALAVFKDHSYPPRDTAGCLEGLAATAAVDGQTTRAARLLGGAAALREAVDGSVRRTDLPLLARTVDRVRTALGDEPYAAAWAAGHVMALDELIADGPVPQPLVTR